MIHLKILSVQYGYVSRPQCTLRKRDKHNEYVIRYHIRYAYRILKKEVSISELDLIVYENVPPVYAKLEQEMIIQIPEYLAAPIFLEKS